jgi:LysR family transcriptional activator of nhaA
MAHLNYKHLRYFWTVAKSGSIARASEQLHVTPQSISGQLSELQTQLGAELLQRAGRGLALTDAGRRILSYAEEIFSLGDELLEVARDQTAQAALPFRIGVADSVPKSVTYRVVEPVLRLQEAVRVICREGRLVALLADLAVHRLDMVIADRAMPADVNVRAYNHLLGASNVTVFASALLAKSLKGAFPACLDQAPFLLPGEGVVIRGALERWFEAQNVSPRVVGEFDDGALLKAFGQSGAGLFVAPTAIADYVCRQYGVVALGQIDAVTEELYAITTERRIRHPAIIAIRETAGQQVFGRAAEKAAQPRTRAVRPSGHAAADSRRRVRG